MQNKTYSKMLNNVFYVLKDAEGLYRPQAFICRENQYTGNNKLEHGDTIVKVSFNEIN